MPLESAPPFIIITAAITVMGLIQSGVHKLTYGKPKATGQDAWDRLNSARDTRVKDEKTVRSVTRGGEWLLFRLFTKQLRPPRPSTHSDVCPPLAHTHRLGDAALCAAAGGRRKA